MKIYNSLTNKKEEFLPIDKGHVKMYSCGPTVYNYFHIGNARPFIFFDVVRRYLQYAGYNVKFIQNFTDVDDKIINRAIQEGTNPKALSEKYIEEYFKDADALGIKRADAHPKVSDNITQIISLIQRLIDKGMAYEKDGNVYYRVSSFAGYGKLSKQDINDLEAGARVEVSGEKEDPLDFALWKKKKEGEIYWDSPFGQGRPGWHIECSAMAFSYLGEQIDIHGGGADLVFPHHENEIAQSEGATGKQFSKYWMHNGYINIDNKKMSKSLGNFFTVRDIAQEFDLSTVRFFILSAHYRNPINFSRDLIKAAENSLERIYNAKNNLDYLISLNKNPKTDDDNEFNEELNRYKKQFCDAMDDDFNTADAIAAIFELVKFININTDENSSQNKLYAAQSLLNELTGVLGIAQSIDTQMLDKDIEELIEKRQQARKDKDFALADKIRDELKAKNIMLEDTKEGVKWKRI
ncbi:MAG: cysteine--tRNA ligase [Eubacteriaceae bacterium]